jgi:hypothetical protein
MEALKMEERVDRWNDDRLDELSRRMDEGFKEMREGFTRVDQEMKAGFIRVDQEMKAGFSKVDQEMKAGFGQIDRDMKAGFEKLATRESVAKVTTDLGRFENRLDRLYWAFIALAVLLTANGIVGNA